MDTGVDGTTSKQLLSRLAQEVSQDSITLTAPGDGSHCEGLTPEMSQWVMQHVDPVRSAAIDALDASAKQIKIRSAAGKLFEKEAAKIEAHKEKRIREHLRTFNQRHHQLIADTQKSRDDYERIRAVEDRDPKIPNRLLEFGVALPVILVFEALINFESFRRAPLISSDAMALGSTLLVGFGIAGASFCWGLYWRRWNYYNLPDAKERNITGLPLAVWGSSLLTISLLAVGYARYNFLLPKIDEALAIGSPLPNLPLSVSGLLLGNLIAFFLGAILTYFSHDPNPDLQEKFEQLNKKKAVLDKLKRRDVDLPIHQATERARVDLDKLKRETDQMHGLPGNDALRSGVAAILTKDQEVVANLLEYRNRMLGASVKGSRPPKLVQHEPEQDKASRETVVTANSWSGMPIRLSWSR